MLPRTARRQDTRAKLPKSDKHRSAPTIRFTAREECNIPPVPQCNSIGSPISYSPYRLDPKGRGIFSVPFLQAIYLLAIFASAESLRDRAPFLRAD
jgi:hypothetical protein